MKFVPEYSKRKLNGIYIIRNTVDQRVYIGECTNFYKRYSRHKSQLLNNKHFNIKLQNFVNKYGIDTLEFDILEIVDTNRIEREMYYIKLYNSINNGFNIVLDSRAMAHITNGSRKKIGHSLKGIKRDPEFSKAVSEGLRAFYDNHPKQTRAKWTEERKQARKEYMATHKENYAHRKPSTGNKINHKRGSDNASALINEEIAAKIKRAIRDKIKRSTIIEKFNITVNVYKDIQRGKTWKHVII
jgi:group I intron endonuclease